LTSIDRILVCAAALVVWAGTAFAVEPRVDGPLADTKAINEAVDRLAPTYGLDPVLVRSIILAESDYDPRAVSWRNARGLMQLMPETAARFGVADPFDPAQNLRGGMSYLRWLNQRFGGNLTLILAAYNAGENAVSQYGGVPPFPETQDYVARVKQYAASGGAIPAGFRAKSSPLVYRAPLGSGAHAAASGGISIERTRFGVTIYRGAPY
jgi:soluble lytic murein transglycosylase-like protein